jgi:hypothetical protein
MLEHQCQPFRTSRLNVPWRFSLRVYALLRHDNVLSMTYYDFRFFPWLLARVVAKVPSWPPSFAKSQFCYF